MALRVISKHMVKPSSPTWSGNVQLTELDQTGEILHASIIYFYQKPTQDWLNNDSSSTTNKAINILKSSLSHALVPFYPFAGRVRWVDFEAGKLELECNGMGAEIIEAEFNIPMSYLQEFKDFGPLIPHVNYFAKPLFEIPVLLAQLTKFQCGGLSLCISVSHVVADGRSSFHFFQEWAKLARGEDLKDFELPYVDRNILQFVRNQVKENVVHNKVPYVGWQPFEPFFIPTLVDEIKQNVGQKKVLQLSTILLPLSRNQVLELKRVANSNTSVEDKLYSRTEVVVAYVWRCACKARGLKSEQLSALSFTVDASGRINPPLPPRYFGNSIVDVFATIQVGELMTKPLSHACKKIREAIEKVNNEFVHSTIEFLKGEKSFSMYQDRGGLGGTHGLFDGNPNFWVVTWLNLPLKGLDFGWGKEIFMTPGYYQSDGGMFVFPGPDDDEQALMVAISLQATHMEMFKKYFYEDMNVLGVEQKNVSKSLSVLSKI